MLRAVIESENKRAYFDFCGTWDKLEKAVRKVTDVDYISKLKVKNDDVAIHITKYSSDIFDKVDLLITPTDSIYDIYFICNKLQYDDIDFKDKFNKEYGSFESITDVRKMFVEYSHNKFIEKSNNEPYGKIKNPNDLIYEPMKIFGTRVLYNEWKIDLNELPRDLYKYELYEENGNICGIGKGVLFNNYGTIISDRPLKLNQDDYRTINEAKDIVYSEEPGVSLRQYIHELKNFEKYSHQR